MKLAGLGAIKATEDSITVHLEGHMSGYAVKGEDDKPIVIGKWVFRLERV